jgi:hypothetical protein
MTVDHIPEGYIGFRKAFENYCGKVTQTDFKVLPREWVERKRTEEELDECAENFVAAFAAGELTGFFSEPQFQRNHEVSEAEWTSPAASLACWRGRLDIADRSAVIFIDASVFSEWLSGVRKGGGKPRTKPGRPPVEIDLAKKAINTLYLKGVANNVMLRDAKLEMLLTQVNEHIAPKTVSRETVRRAKVQIIAKM